MPHGEGQHIGGPELDRLRDLINPPQMTAQAERLTMELGAMRDKPKGPRDRSELLDLLAESKEARAIRAGMARH